MYAKIFSKIHDSSIANDYEVRFVFMDLMLLCDANGTVDITHEAIARRTNVPIEIVRRAIQKLEEPDPQSRSATDDGRRIERLDGHREWGWRIINFEFYRGVKTKDDLRAGAAMRQKKFRDNAQQQLLDVPDLTAQAEEIYQLYPLKSARPEALRAIIKALSKEPFSKLLEQTRRFSQVRGGDLAFCPRPATWFNQERYNDDPQTWINQNDKTNRPNGQQRVDRNKGTYNEGLPSIASELAAKARAANVPGPDIGATGGGDSQVL